jgi:hypothetical protein
MNEYHWRAEFFALAVRYLVPSSFHLKQKKPGDNSRAFINENGEKDRASESSSERMSRTRTRFFSYLDPSRSEDFALLEYVTLS